MTSTEVTIDDHNKKTKKSFFGSSNNSKKEMAPPEQAKASDDGSVSSTASTKKTKTWLGKEVKRPRAEYQAEIDALKLKIASLETDLERCTVELQQFKDWVGMAPSTFWTKEVYYCKT